jgi:hypothetical protein
MRVARQRSSQGFLAAVLGTVVLLSAVARADFIAYQAGPLTGSQNYADGLGMDFDVLAPTGIIVTQLGAYDSGGDGLAAPITVRLYARNNNGTPAIPGDDTGGAILAEVIFPTGAASQALPFAAGHRFMDIMDVVLAPGSYTIVARGYGADLNGNSNGTGNWGVLDSGGGLIAFVGTSRYGGSGGFPNSIDAAVQRYGAGSFQFYVPEPGSACLAAVAAAGAWLGTRRRPRLAR